MNPIDREAVKTLAIAIGVREAARQLGLNENTVRQWSRRFQWFKRPTLPPTHNESKAVTSVTTPSNVLQSELEKNGHETKLSLSRYTRNISKKSEAASIKSAPLVHKVAQTAALVHGWQDQKQGQSNVMVNIALMGVEPEQIQVETEAIDET